MKTIIKIFLLLTFFSLGCEKDCKTKNPTELSTNGCGDLMVYDQINVNGNTNSYIVIKVIRDELVLNNNFSSFDIIADTSIDAYIDELNKEGSNYCTDAIDPEIKILKTWEITEGSVDIRIVREKNDCDSTYVVDIVLRNALFTDSEANHYIISYKEFKNVLVNFIIG